MQRGGKRHERHAAAVGPLGDGLAATYRAPFLQGDRHGAGVVRHRRAVRPQQSPRAAPQIDVELRPEAPHRGCGFVEVGDPASGVSQVNGGRQRIEELAGMRCVGEIRQRLLKSNAVCEIGQRKSHVRHCATPEFSLTSNTAVPFLFRRRNIFRRDELSAKCRISNRRAEKSALGDGTGMGEKGYHRAHNEPARHANFDVHGLGEGRHQEEHDEE